MCAFLTGVAFHGGIDKAESQDMLSNHPKRARALADKLAYMSVDAGETAVTIWPTPGRLNDGSGRHYGVNEDADYILRARNTRIKREHTRDIKAARFNCQFAEAERLELDEAAKLTKPLDAHPAYESVAIFFERKPNQRDIDLLKERAQLFAC